MKPGVTKIQFAIWFLVMTAGFSLWVVDAFWAWNAAIFLLGISQFFIMTRAERSRPLTRWDALIFIAVTVFFSVLLFCIWVARDAGSVLYYMRHPAIVAPIWILSVWVTYIRCSPQWAVSGASEVISKTE